MTQKRMGPKPDAQAGEKLFRALRELEIQFLNGGHSVQTSIQALLKDHKFTPTNEMAKYLIAQSILKKDPDNGSHKKPYYFYNGPRLSVQYCNELILQMKIERAADGKIKKDTSYMKDGRTIQGTPFDENLYKDEIEPEKSPMGAHLKDPKKELKWTHDEVIQNLMAESIEEVEHHQRELIKWQQIHEYLKAKI